MDADNTDRIPPQDESAPEQHPLPPSGDRPPPARGILKNPIRGGSMSEASRNEQ